MKKLLRTKISRFALPVPLFGHKQHDTDSANSTQMADSSSNLPYPSPSLVYWQAGSISVVKVSTEPAERVCPENSLSLSKDNVVLQTQNRKPLVANDHAGIEALKPNSPKSFIKNDKEKKGCFKRTIRQNIKLIVVTILLLISFNNKSYSCYFLSAYQTNMTVCASNPATTLYTYTSNLSSCYSSWTANSVTFYYSTDFSTWIYLNSASGSGAVSCNLPTLSSYSGDVYVKAVMGGTFVVSGNTYNEIEDRLTYHYQPSATTAPTLTQSESSVSKDGSVTYTNSATNVGYTWSLPGTSGTDYTITSGSISSQSLTVTWKTTGSKTVTGYFASACGNSPNSTLTTTVLNSAPSTLSYASSPITATYGVAITNASPTVAGTVDSYSINPTLPTGLSFNTSSGVISGTPTMISAQTDYTVTASNAGGSTTATVKITIDKKELTIAGATTSNKVYDGSITATVTGGTLSGISFSDAITLTQAGTFASKNVANSIAITSTCSISGANAGNYTLTQPALTARNITVKALTVSGATTTNKVYDGNTTASVTGGTLVGIVSPDVVTLTQSGTFADKNVANSIAITSTCSIGGADAANYTLTQPTLTAGNITAVALTVSGATTTNKVYDGTNTASVTGGTLVGIVSPDVVILTQSGTFASKNVGNSIAITSTSTLGGANAANYTLTQPTLAARNITAIALTISGATTINKVYDGTITASVTGGILVGVVSPDVVTLTQSGTFADKNVANSIAITSTCSIGGADVANYTLTQPTLTARSITAKALTVSGATTTNKVYDGTIAASVTGGALVGVVSPDVVTLTQSGTFADKNVANSIAITSTCSIGGADVANYTLTQPTLTAMNITAKALTVSGATTSDKIYDRTTTASVTGGTLTGIVSPDVVTLTQSGTFASKNVGNSIAITSTSTLGGANAANYTLTQPTLTARNITAIALTVSGATTTNKVYDGTTTASVTGGTLVGIVSPDAVTLTQSGIFSDKIVGNSIAITSTCSIGGTDVANYTLTQPTLTARNITLRSLVVTATGVNKVYDQNVNASVILSDNRVSGDILTSTYIAASFTDKTVNTGKTVNVSGISISGTDAGNYTFNTIATATANITAKALTVSATGTDKVYNGSATGIVTLGDDRFAGDELTTSYTAATFSNKNVGENKAVNVSGISIAGTDAGNYTFNTIAATTANITSRTLLVSASGINKVYDGNTTGSVTLSDDRVSGDLLTTNYTTAIFPDSNVENGKVVSVSGISILGTDAGNYTANTNTGTTANITQKALTITADAKTKVYDGSVYSPFTVNYSAFITGEDETDLAGTLSFTGTATSATNVGTGYVITPGGLTSSNYAITFENGSLEITKSDQTITFAALAGKTFGDAPFDLTATASSGLTISYASSNTGMATISGSTVTIIGAGTTIITASQSGNGNYNAATSVSQPLTVANQAQTIVFETLSAKTYGDAPFTVSATGGDSGNPVVFSSSDASVATCSGTNGSIITITGAGSCTIYANQAGNGDYGAAPYVARTLTVNKADQTVTFNALTDKTYGNAPFTLGGTASSGLTVTYTSSNTDVATISGNMVTIHGVGSATITARQAGNTNYNAATSVDQTLTVVKADQTISFAALAGKTYGDAPFGLTGTASSGLAVTYSSSNTSVATISGNTVTIVGAGTTKITASQAGNVNYNAATPVEQPLTVGKSSQTISLAALAEKTYGDAAFDLSATSTSGLAISYNSSNTAVATVSGSTVTIVGAGTATITASQGGDANYTAATSAGQTLTVNKASQILTLNPLPTGSQPLKEATGPVQLSASSTSGLPVVISLGSGSAATLNGSNQLIGIGQSGTIVVNVDQSGNTNYNAASISATFDLGKPNQSILFPAMSDRIYSPGLTVDLNGLASASSTLPVSYSVISGPATLSGTVLTITGSGVVLIKASQAGDATWNAAPEVTRSLTIHKASIVIDNFADLEKTYGDAPFTLAASSVSTGLFSYSSSNAAVVTVSGNTVTLTGAGTAELTVVQAEDANYASVSTTVILKVLQADQTISFGPLSGKTYGDADFALTGTASSGLTVSYTSSNPDVAIVSGNMVSITGAGTTTITATQPGNTNYKAAEPVAQTLAVGKKSQAITFDALAGKTYGDADFNLTATASSGLSVTYASSNQAVATVSGSTVTIVGAGTSIITASQAGNENYLGAPDVPQSLTVSKASQVLTLSPLPIGSLALKDITFPIQVTAISSSGLPVAITLGVGSAATLNGSNQLENIQQSGTITIQLNQAGNANYNAANASYSFDVEKSNQHITFPAITNRVLSAGLTIDLSGMAYASSGLAVSYALVSGPATLSGTVLTISGAGDVVVTASQSGNSTWNAAPAVTQTISIGKSLPEITNFADLFKTYGDPSFSLNASSVSSGAVTFTSSDPSVATMEGSQVIIKGAGTAVLTAQQVSDNNYALASATASLFVEKAEQTISFDAVPVKTYGDDPFGLSAVSTSGLTISYASSNEEVATVSGNTVTITGAGTTIITATQAGNSNYKAATAITRTLTVNKQSQAIAFAALDGKAYGDAPFTLTATGGGSGNPVTFTSSDNTVATVSGSMVILTGAGSCTIYAHQAGDANYSAAPQIGRVLIVGKSDQTISFEALADKIYGDAAFNPAATSTSALGVSYISSNTAVATVSGSTVTITGAGTTSITAIQSGNSNYNAATPVVQNLTVIKSNQTITFAALAGKTYGDAPFGLTGTASSGLTVSYASSNTGMATISGSTVTIIGAGTTIITASQSGNGNYNAATSVSQPLTVANQAQTIVFETLSAKTYGDAPFTVSATGGGSDNPVIFTSSDASVATVSGNIITITGAGSCTIYANQAGNGDYGTAVNVGQTLTVGKAGQTISFAALSNKTYGDAPFSVSATGGGSGNPVIFTSSDASVATCSGTNGSIITITGAGSCTIFANQAGNSDYNTAAFIGQTLTVANQSQTIVFEALAGKIYGDAPFGLTGTASSGLAVTYSSSNTSVATISGNTVTIVGAGTTTITASQSGNANYNAATPVEQNLTVIKYITGDKDGDGKITPPLEVTGDKDGDGKITPPLEVTGDKDGDGKITPPLEVTGDKDGDGKITPPLEVTGDKDGDGKITPPLEVTGDKDGDGKITPPLEVTGDKDGDGKITPPLEVTGDKDGDGKITPLLEVTGDKDGDGKITPPFEVTGDKDGDGKITPPFEVTGDKDGDGKITPPLEVAGDTDGDGKITYPEILGDTNGDGKITAPEITGDANGDGKIDNGETAGNTGGTGTGIAGDSNGDGKITYPEITGDKNGDGKIDGNEITGDINGDGIITSPEILGDTSGDGHINGNEIAGDRNGNGVIDPTETRVIDPEKDHLNVDHLFSPNGDGINDYWKLRDIEKFGRVYVKIYDRWGTLLYETTNYQNDWDGTSKGKSLPEGAYIYFIKTEKDGNKTGVVNIVR